jgi:hypothetical protein
MTQKLIVAAALFAFVLLSALSAAAQDPTPPPSPEIFGRSLIQGQGQVQVQGPLQQKIAPGIETKANTFYWIESEFAFDGKTVKGSPYSAEAVTERTQTLSDGNRIVNKSSTKIYRDSEGRTRREQDIDFPGNITGQTIKTVIINDPVAGVTYSLDPEARTARKSKMFHFDFQGPTVSTSETPKPARVSGATASSGDFVFSTNGPGVPGIGPTFSFNVEDESKNVVKESLGNQNIEGVEAEGSRTTRTIPAGTIGNERPIAIVDERWYSPTLQTVVMIRHSDPRSGENVYRLTNIDRSEPAHVLFEVPGDYQIKEQSFNLVTPARVRKPE